jgi:hypothetical protein
VFVHKAQPEYQRLVQDLMDLKLIDGPVKPRNEADEKRSRTTDELNESITSAKDAGWVDGDGQPLLVDIVGQAHRDAAKTRNIVDPTKKKKLESAHLIATSFFQSVLGRKTASEYAPNYRRKDAVTVLFPEAVHETLDRRWKEWAREQARNRATCTVRKMLGVMHDAIYELPNEMLNHRQRERFTGCASLRPFRSSHWAKSRR